MTENYDAVKFLVFHLLSGSREKGSTVFAAVCVLGLSKAGLEPLVLSGVCRTSGLCVQIDQRRTQ